MIRFDCVLLALFFFAHSLVCFKFVNPLKSLQDDTANKKNKF